MEIERVYLSRRAVSDLHQDLNIFDWLPKIFSYLLQKHRVREDADVRMAVTDSYEMATQILISDENVVIVDLNFSHQCYKIREAFVSSCYSDLNGFNCFVLGEIERHLQRTEAGSHALWLSFCRMSLHAGWAHNHRLRKGDLPKVATSSAPELIDIKIESIAIVHELRHYLLAHNILGPEMHSSLNLWISDVQEELFPDLSESEFQEIVKESAVELICDNVPTYIWDEFDWDIQTGSATAGVDFGIAIFSVALFFDILARLQEKHSDFGGKSLQLRSAVLRRSAFFFAGHKNYPDMCKKYECLREHAFAIIDCAREILSATPPREVLDFKTPNFAVEYFNGYDRKDDDDWSTFLMTDIETWHEKLASVRLESDDHEVTLIDRICLDSLAEPWLFAIVNRLYLIDA